MYVAVWLLGWVGVLFCFVFCFCCLFIVCFLLLREEWCIVFVAFVFGLFFKFIVLLIFPKQNLGMVCGTG